MWMFLAVNNTMLFEWMKLQFCISFENGKIALLLVYNPCSTVYQFVIEAWVEQFFFWNTTSI